MKLLLILFLPSILLLQSCAKIDFVYKFGHAYGDQLYTSKNLYVQDMICDPDLKIDLKLTRKEKKVVLEKLNEMNFWNYPAYYQYETTYRDSFVDGHGCTWNDLIFTYGKKQKELKWCDCNYRHPSVGLQYEKLKAISDLIWKMIYTNDAYKNSKKPRCGYL